MLLIFVTVSKMLLIFVSVSKMLLIFDNCFMYIFIGCFSNAYGESGRGINKFVIRPCEYTIISLKANLFSPWYSCKITELVLNNNQSLTHSLKMQEIKIKTTTQYAHQYLSNKYIFDIAIPFCHPLYLSATLKQCFTEFAAPVMPSTMCTCQYEAEFLRLCTRQTCEVCIVLAHSNSRSHWHNYPDFEPNSLLFLLTVCG
jgi:hypothetical protein